MFWRLLALVIANSIVAAGDLRSDRQPPAHTVAGRRVANLGTAAAVTSQWYPTRFPAGTLGS